MTAEAKRIIDDRINSTVFVYLNLAMFGWSKKIVNGRAKIIKSK